MTSPVETLTCPTGPEVDAASTIPPSPSEEKVREFLLAIGGPWHICPSNHWAGFTFHDIDTAVAAAVRANKEGCVYFMPNTPKYGRLSGHSRKKSDIAWVNAAFLDIDDPDPEIAKELANRLDWPPTYIAFTGGGWQAMWRLSEPVRPREGEAISVWLQQQFEDLSPDSTHSCEHIFRLPGTRNRKTSRNNCLCEIHSAKWDNLLPIQDAGRAEIGPRRHPVSLDLGPSLDINPDELWDVLPPWAIKLRESAIDRNGKPYASRSEHEWAFIGMCIRDGTPKELIRDFLIEPAGIDDTHKVSHRAYWAKVKGEYVPRRNPEAHAYRQIGSYLSQGGAHV